MIQCLIVDDEPLAQDVIEKYIQQSAKLQLVQKCSNALEAFAVLEKQPVDIMFIDIAMPVVNGMDFIRSLKTLPAVVFTTAYAEYAAHSYELEALDYLVKPVTYERFAKTIDKFFKHNIKPDTDEKKYFYIKVNGRLQKVFYADILYAESMRDYIRIVTVNETHLTHLTMKALAALLPTGHFIRVHRSFIVHKLFIRSVGRKELLINEFKIPVGDNYKQNLAALK
ncbi:MAG: response regulator transcription factor [Ferruginibacter sp.]|nr:response regulator transcription factor [Ferruginibacter sp.]